MMIMAFMLVPHAASAEYFVWQDPKTGASLTFPDTWRTINNQKPDDLVTLIGPSRNDRPICRLRARDDARWLNYPIEYSRDVQHFAYDRDFWIDYTGDYNDVVFDFTKDDAGLGQAFASMVVVNFTDPLPKVDGITRMGQMWAGVYHDTAYILDCSSTRASFIEWQPDFVGIAKSVTLRPVMTQTPHGYYPERFVEPGYTDTQPTGAANAVLGQSRGR
jgi:hypothetical protein